MLTCPECGKHAMLEPFEVFAFACRHCPKCTVKRWGGPCCLCGRLRSGEDREHERRDSKPERDH